MDTGKILRTTKEYEIPQYIPGKRNCPPENHFSDYYLNWLSLPKGNVNVNLAQVPASLVQSPQGSNKGGLNAGRLTSPNRRVVLTSGRTSVASNEEIVHPGSSVTKNATARLGRTNGGSWAMANCQANMNHLYYGQDYDYTNPDSCIKKLRKNQSEQKVLTFKGTRKPLQDPQFFRVRDIAKLNDVQDAFKKVSPDKFGLHPRAFSKTDSLIRCPTKQPTHTGKRKGLQDEPFFERGRWIPYDRVEDLELDKRTKDPLGVLDKFEQLTTINMQNAAKLLEGTEEEKAEALAHKNLPTYVDLCAYNERCRNFIPALCPTYTAPESAVDFDRNSRVRSKVFRAGTQASRAATILQPLATMSSFANAKTEMRQHACSHSERRKSESTDKHKPTTTQNASPIAIPTPASTRPLQVQVQVRVRVNARRHSEVPAEVRQLSRLVVEKTRRTREIAKLCHKCAEDIQRKEFQNQEAKFVAKEMEREVARRPNYDKVYNAAVEQLRHKDFNINKRYNVDNAQLQKYRQHLQRAWVGQKAPLRTAPDEGFKSDSARIRTDLLVSRMIYAQNRHKLI